MNIPILNGQLPQGFCPPDYQTMLNGFSAVQFVNLNLLNNLIVSSSPPADHTAAWLQLDSQGNPVRMYVFAQGAWLSPHPLPTGFTMIWNLALPNFTTFDGGDAVAAPYSAITGQMWQLMASTTNGLDAGGKKSTDPGYVNPAVMVAQFPLGVGTFAAPPAGSGTVVGVGSTGGEELHLLQNNEMFPHAHVCKALKVEHGTTDTLVLTGHLITSDPAQQPDDRTLIQGGDPSTGNPPINSLGHNNIPPYYGVYFLQRTTRLFYRV